MNIPAGSGMVFVTYSMDKFHKYDPHPKYFQAVYPNRDV